MKRIALIIATPNYPKKPLPGAEQDSQDWEAFLPSVEGGAWHSSEVHVLRDPTRLTVGIWLALLRTQKPDFALLAFSGHGEVVQTQYARETRLYLSPTEYLTEQTFTIGSQRELLIMDACRELRIETESIIKLAASNVREWVSKSDENRLAIARELYDANIARNPAGRTFVYSCSIDETASDEPSFSRVLIGEGKRLAIAAPYRGIISIREAFDSASTVVRQNFIHTQTPVYNGGRRLTDLPFAASV